jgi:predicted nucleic acid-binding protein
VFLDTNVLFSAFATRGLCAELFELVLLEHDLALGRRVQQELRNSLRTKLKLAPSVTREILDFVTAEAAVVVGNASPATANASPDDVLVLGEALAAGAEVFVTGDAALLRLGAVANMRIVSPRGLWEVLRQGKK